MYVSHFSVGKSLFYTAFVYVGLPLASVLLFGSVRLWKIFNIFAHIILPLSFLGCFAIAILFTYFAAMPTNNLFSNGTLWKAEVRRKLDRKLILSLPDSGLTLGPYGLVEEQLGTRISDGILMTLWLFSVSPKWLFGCTYLINCKVSRKGLLVTSSDTTCRLEGNTKGFVNTMVSNRFRLLD